MLVATTVIEVGVDVPNATLMIVEGAERFGLAQLHQLRGRVGRGTGKSICLLIRGQTLTEVGRARLALMRETNDGFRIAEEDLRLRGPGEILGTRQSGEEAFRVATPEDVAELAPIAQSDAQLLLDRDGGLAGPRGQAARICLYLFERDQAVGPDQERLADEQPVLLLAEAELHRLVATSASVPGSLTTTSSSRTAPSAILRFASPFDAREAERGQRLRDGHAVADGKRRQIVAGAAALEGRRARSLPPLAPPRGRGASPSPRSPARSSPR